jgi:hypothetical protein
MSSKNLIGLFPYVKTIYGDSALADEYWAIMANDVCHGLQNYHINCGTCTLSLESFSEILSTDYVLTFNYMPAIKSDEGSFWVEHTNPVILMALDHPAYLYSDIKDQVESGCSNGKRFFGVMEAEHLQFLYDHGVAAEKCFVFPQAGPPVCEMLKPMSKRSIDLVFLGRIHMPVDLDTFLNDAIVDNALLYNAVRESFDNILDRVLNSHDDVYAIIVSVIEKFDLSIKLSGTEEGALLTKNIDAYIRQIRRYNMLLKFKDLPVHVIGIVDKKVVEAFPNFHFIGPLSFKESLEYLKDTKILLNDTINLRSSLLMRFFYGIAQGCLIASEVNPYILEQFDQGRDFIPVYRDSNKHMHMVQMCLRDHEYAQSIYNRAQKKYIENHQWANRVAPLAKIIHDL